MLKLTCAGNGNRSEANPEQLTLAIAKAKADALKAQFADEHVLLITSGTNSF